MTGDPPFSLPAAARARPVSEYEVLLEVAEAIALHRDLRALFHDLFRLLPRVVRFDSLSLVLHQPAQNTMRLHIFETEANASMDVLERPIEESPSGLVWQTQRPLIIPNTATEERFSDAMQRLQEAGIQSFCALPLTTAHRRLGAMGFGSKRFGAYSDGDPSFLSLVARQVSVAVDNALAHEENRVYQQQLAEERLYLNEEIRLEHNFEEIIGESSALHKVLDQTRTVAPTDSTVLILGETGTGKELVARAIHDISPRRNHTFVKLNCAAIPLGLLESELFGHEKGAFTGAIAQKLGRFELAHNGTLFLDEIGDIPLELQPKLLRVLQEHEFERLGSTRTIRVNVRIVAATSHDLTSMVGNRSFRRDLYYRLNIFPITVPPLRDRRSDIPLLVRYFVDKYARKMARNIDTIPAMAMDAIMRYGWPGNVRELENFIERSVILSRSRTLQVPPLEVKPSLDRQPVQQLTLAERERQQIVQALEESGWVLGGPGGAAERLGLKRTTLFYRMRRFGITRPASRQSLDAASID